MASFAKISINLGATTATLKRDLNQGANDVRNFRNQVNAAMGGGGGGLFGSLFAVPQASGGGGILGGYAADMKLLAGMENLAKNVAGKLVTLAGAATLANVSLAGMNAQMSQMDKTGKLADSLNTTTEALQQLRYAAALAGPGADAAEQAIGQMISKLGEIRAGGASDAAATLERIGLNVNTLAQMDPVAAFGRIAEGISKLTTSADRAAAAQDLFGKSGRDLLPMLALGESGLAAMAAEADRLGFSFSRVDAAKIEEANDSITRLELAWVAFVQQLTVSAAPAIQMIADGLSSTTANLRQMSDMVDGNTIRVAAFTAATLLSITAGIKAVRMIEQITTSLRAMQVSLIAVNALSGPGGWLKLALGVSVAATSVLAFEKMFGDVARKAGSSTKAVEAFGEATKQAAAKAKGELIELKGDFGTGWLDVIDAGKGDVRVLSDQRFVKDPEAFRNAAMQKRIELQSKALEYTKEEWAAHEKASAKLMADASKWTSIGNRIAESVATPAEKARTAIAEIDGALAQGVINADVHAKAVANVLKQFNDADAATKRSKLEAQQTVKIGAVTRNTIEGFSAVQSGRAELKKLEQRALEQLRAQQQANRLLEDIRTNTKDKLVVKQVRLSG